MSKDPHTFHRFFVEISNHGLTTYRATTCKKAIREFNAAAQELENDPNAEPSATVTIYGRTPLDSTDWVARYFLAVKATLRNEIYFSETN